MAEKLAGAGAVLARAVAGGAAGGAPPGAALAVITSVAEASYAWAGGFACLPGQSANPVECGEQTAFDLASLTKVLVTVPLALLLRQRGAWSIDDPVARWLPGAPESAVTVRQCLTHTSGLVAHRRFFESGADAGAIRSAVVAELAGAKSGPVLYSDLGYMLAGWAVENCAGESLDVLAARELFGPLGMAETGYLPSLPRARIAATEADGDERSGRGLIWGEVHDGNAWALGGVSGHAGVFGTAGDLGRFAGALLRPQEHPVLSPSTIELMTSRQARDGDDVRALGWRLGTPASAGWGDWPEGTIWHTGFTGTSLLVSPALGVAVVLLTNGVHPVRRPTEIAVLRASVHRAVLAAL